MQRKKFRGKIRKKTILRGKIAEEKKLGEKVEKNIFGGKM